MIKSSEDRRVEIVLNAFDALFNKRDYASAERLWSPRYIQHSAHIAPGRDGLFRPGQRPRPRRCATRTTLRRRAVISSFCMGGSVVTASRRRRSSLTSCAWRMASCEHWDVIQDEATRDNRAVCRCSVRISLDQ